MSAYVKSCVVDCAPQALDWACFSTLDDICNHVYWAKTALQQSKFDQQNLFLMIKDWQIIIFINAKKFLRKINNNTVSMMKDILSSEFYEFIREQWKIFSFVVVKQYV